MEKNKATPETYDLTPGTSQAPRADLLHVYRYRKIPKGKRLKTLAMLEEETAIESNQVSFNLKYLRE